LGQHANGGLEKADAGHPHNCGQEAGFKPWERKLDLALGDDEL